MPWIDFHGMKKYRVDGECYKVPYKSIAAARKVIRKTSHQKAWYKCNTCGSIHTTTQKRK